MRPTLPVCILLLAGSFVQCGEALVVRASQTVTPIIESAKGLIAAKHPDATFKITPCGTKASIDAVATGTAQLGATVRQLKDEEKAANSDLVLTEIGKDGVALIVNAENPVTDLSTKQVCDLLTGVASTWKELGGADAPITAVGRTEANAIVEFVDSVLGLEHQVVGEGKDQGMTYKLKGATAFGTSKIAITGKHLDAVALVTKSLGGFTFAPLGMAREAKAKGSAIKIVSYKGIEASDEAVLHGTYPLSRSLFLMTKGPPQGLVKDLVDAVLTAEGQKIVAERGCIPLH